MATRYTVTVLREEYIPDSDHVTGSVKYEVEDIDLSEALTRVEAQTLQWGWLAFNPEE